jgi:magnesium transporter
MALFTKKYSTPGSAPGEILATHDASSQGTLSVMDFSAAHLVEKIDISVDEGREYLLSPTMTWLHVQGNLSPKSLNRLGDACGLHTLALEDVVKEGQRTKLESYDEQYFLVINLPVESEGVLHAEQVSLFLGAHYLLSIHQGDKDIWEPVRQRLRVEPPRSIRTAGPDYLLYALLDTVIDHAFPVLETIGNQIESIEEFVFADPTTESLDTIHAIRHKLIYLRRQLWPQREMLNILIRDDGELINARTKVFLRDCYDHTVQIIELIESYREMTASLHDLYLSSLSNRMNQVMKVLTIIATIFIPLTFVAGIYGMNFDTKRSPWNMPELGAYYGYPAVWLVMIAVVVAMLIYFKRKRWF